MSPPHRSCRQWILPWPHPSTLNNAFNLKFQAACKIQGKGFRWEIDNNTSSVEPSIVVAAIFGRQEIFFEHLHATLLRPNFGLVQLWNPDISSKVYHSGFQRVSENVLRQIEPQLNPSLLCFNVLNQKPCLSEGKSDSLVLNLFQLGLSNMYLLCLLSS